MDDFYSDFTGADVVSHISRQVKILCGIGATSLIKVRSVSCYIFPPWCVKVVDSELYIVASISTIPVIYFEL